jgi:hypothetical protein
LIADLVRTLKILDDNRYVGKDAGGVNDTGYEELLWEHYVLNLPNIKKALANAVVKPKPKKKKLGQTVQQRSKKKLGKKANER